MGLFGLVKKGFGLGGRASKHLVTGSVKRSFKVVGFVGPKGLKIADKVFDKGSSLVFKGSKVTIKHISKRSIEFVDDSGKLVSLPVKEFVKHIHLK